MDSMEAGVHRLDDGTIIHVCDCKSCLRKTGGRNLRVSKATYFRHKPSRCTSIFLPPIALSIAPDLPSPDLRRTPPPAASSSSKRPQEDLDGGGPINQKKGRSDSPELVHTSEPDPHPDDAHEDFYQYDGLEYDTIPEALPDNRLPDEVLLEEDQNSDQPRGSQGVAQPDQQPPAAPIESGFTRCENGTRQC
ncbi:uncharacterized protein BJ212DRAFT_1591162 [Suillus subaureus]|uniref:Uncharacterized protein n=1 Tax=Suillus subaureus TaxID=48587 RepID=A0A9P7DUL6_9AGAM|nr:uncharacterized protein BJ212DRAFT_1591162 [Suillus subaureus]KAG1803405.1 hypothetical protein BJ212DRAFT_1591162 [Suillus subaureus]